MCLMYSVIVGFQGGIYLFQVMDWYSATFSLIMIGWLECIVIGWFYGEFSCTFG